MSEPTKIPTAFQSRRKIIESNLNAYLQELAAIDALGEIGEGASWIYIMSCLKTIEVTPRENTTAREVALTVLRRLNDIGQHPQKADKTFDKENGKITFTIPGPMPGWKIQVSGGEPRCKVKKVVERKEVPVYTKVQSGTAFKEVTRYEIENPEECGAEVEG